MKISTILNSLFITRVTNKKMKEKFWCHIHCCYNVKLCSSLFFFVLCQIFLAQNFDVNSQDVGGWGAMHEAAYAGRQDFIERLLCCSADIDIQNSDGATPLFTAAQYGRLTCLKLLLKKGADVNKLTVDNASPLFIAAQEGLADCLTALLSSGEFFSIHAFFKIIFCFLHF